MKSIAFIITLSAFFFCSIAIGEDDFDESLNREYYEDDLEYDDEEASYDDEYDDYDYEYDEDEEAEEVDDSGPRISIGTWGVSAGYANSAGVTGLEGEYVFYNLTDSIKGSAFIGLGSGFSSTGMAFGSRGFYPMEALPFDSYLFGEFSVSTLAIATDGDSDKEEDILGPSLSIGIRSFFYKNIGVSLSMGLGFAPQPSWYDGDDSSIVSVGGLTFNYVF